jgi:signal transduction histidine kinase
MMRPFRQPGRARSVGSSAARSLVLRPLAVSAAVVLGVGQLVGTLRLRERHRLLQERDAARSALLRFAAHETRTPLSLARGYVDMVRSGTLGPIADPAREALGLVDERLGEIEELAGQLVEAARMQDEKPRLRPELLDLRAVVREAVDRTEHLSGARHRVVIDQPEPVAIVADRLRIRALVTNLVSNAIKYSPEGGEVRCVLRAGHGLAELSVTDRGIGIDEASMSQLFQPFNRLGREATRIKGLGLGLFVAREIARAHGGDLTAERNPAGRGTTFRLRLPEATVRDCGPGVPTPAGRALATQPA